MVLQKRLYYGFNGYQVPVIPRASRSARGRRSFGKKAEDSQMCAFDLLATVAGELLLLKDSDLLPSNVSPGRTQFVTEDDNIKQEQEDGGKPSISNHCDQGSSDETASSSKVGSHVHGPDYVVEDHSHAEGGVTLPTTSIKARHEILERITCSDESISRNKKGGSALRKCHNGKGSSDFAEFTGGIMDDQIERLESIHGTCHTGRGSSGFVEIPDGKMEDQIDRWLEVGQQRLGCMIHGTTLDMSSSKEPMQLDIKPPALVSLDSSIKVPLSGDHLSGGLFPRCQDDVKVVIRDDDENSSRCTQRCTISLKAFRSPHLYQRRIRKMLASKFWKVSPTFPEDRELSDSDLERKPAFCSKESRYTRQRTQRCSPFKKRKLFERSLLSTSERGISGERASNSPEDNGNVEAAGSCTILHGAAVRASPPVAGQESSWKSENSHVKLSIKSFKVPELIIEVPETATIGSLKRSVVEAVSSILGGGLQIGVLLQGKKVRDDDKTLGQTGILCDDKVDTLGFMLEPNRPQAPCLCPEDHPHLMLPRDASQPPPSYPVVPRSDPVVPDVSPDPPLANKVHCIENDHDSVLSPTDMSSEKSTLNSRALVSIPTTMSVEALAVVPLPRKSRQSELVQRRMRRPFSVSEVEALVQAVEKLGTGRWRDVKLRAFENAKHRTYVDLKDKWKTLVHTARISPQQRRGEPVPQELLDRVLSAHGYWSQQQAKQHIKPQVEPCLL